jgi:hypothetical protein
MAIDLNTIPQPRRGKLIELGKQFGSQDTLNQANKTLDAYTKHATALHTAGFGPKHAKELTDARDGLLAAGVGRESAKTKKKALSKGYVEAMNTALSARLIARAVLSGTQEDLEGSAEEAQLRAEREARATLERTSAAPDQAEPLAQQLAQLQSTLQLASVETAAADHGGAEAMTKLQGAIAALRKADQEDVGVRGTPTETELLDLLDGIIVQLVRRARRAAQAVARATGNFALLKEFRLDKLYGARGGNGPDDDEDEGPVGIVMKPGAETKKAE